MILCGDFNCQPGSGGLRLLQDKKVGRALDDWNDGIHLPFTFLDTPLVLRVSYPYARTLYIYVRICVARSVYVYVPTSVSMYAHAHISLYTFVYVHVWMRCIHVLVHQTSALMARD